MGRTEHNLRDGRRNAEGGAGVTGQAGWKPEFKSGNQENRKRCERPFRNSSE
jgi:hypothetical protein